MIMIVPFGLKIHEKRLGRNTKDLLFFSLTLVKNCCISVDISNYFRFALEYLRAEFGLDF